MNKRRILSIILAVAITVGGVAGVSAAVRRNNSRNAKVLVVPATELNYGGDYMSGAEMEGYLTAGRTQSVYAGSTEVIKEVHVKQDQEVRKGDLLITYDTTKTNLNLELAKVNKEGIELEKQTIEANIATLGKMRPAAESSGDAIFPDDAIDDMGDDTGDDMGEDLPADEEEESAEPDEGGTDSKEEEPKIDLEKELEKQKAEIESQLKERLAAKVTEADAELGKQVAEAADLEAAYDLVKAKLGEQGGEEVIREAIREQLRTAFEESDPEFYKELDETENIEKMIEALIGKIKAQQETDPGTGEGTDPGSGTGTNTDTKGGSTAEPVRTIVAIRPLGAPKSVNLLEGPAGQRALYQGGQAEAVLVEEESSGSGSGDAGIDMSMPSIDSLISSDESYTKEQLEEAKKEQKERLRDCELSMKEAELNIRIAERALDKGEVRAEMDGVVRTVGDPQNPNMDGSPFLQVSSTAGISAKGGIPELDLDTIKVGDPVMVTSWNTGMRFSGSISEISPYPDTSGDFNMWGASGSYYPFTALLDGEDTEFEEHEWVQITIGSGDGGADEALMGDDALMEEGVTGDDALAEEGLMGDDALMEEGMTGDDALMEEGVTGDDALAEEGLMGDDALMEEGMTGDDALAEGDGLAESQTFTLIRAFIREDADVPYVYKRGEDGLLVKQEVRLGKLSGDSYEIKSGVTEKDYLAFPYGKNVKEGAGTREGSLDELQGM